MSDKSSKGFLKYKMRSSRLHRERELCEIFFVEVEFVRLVSIKARENNSDRETRQRNGSNSELGLCRYMSHLVAVSTLYTSVS
jgi:hypothetical protein